MNQCRYYYETVNISLKIKANQVGIDELKSRIDDLYYNQLVVPFQDLNFILHPVNV